MRRRRSDAPPSLHACPPSMMRATMQWHAPSALKGIRRLTKKAGATRCACCAARGPPILMLCATAWAALQLAATATATTPQVVRCPVHNGGVVFVDECGDGFCGRDTAGQLGHTEVIYASNVVVDLTARCDKPTTAVSVALSPVVFKTDDAYAWASPRPWKPPSEFPMNRCPCGELCKPLSSSTRRHAHKKRFFGFWATKLYNGSSVAWHDWDWESISTVAVWSIWDLPAANWSMLCRAHSEGVQVVVPFRGGDYHGEQILNVTARHEWITNQVSELAYFGLDGTNFDIEGQYNASRRTSLTNLICETQEMQQQYLPESTLTMDLDITPDNAVITGGYDYQALSQCLDYIVPMAYDMTGREVGANAPLPLILDGVQRQYHTLGVAPSKLIVALPWYAYSFICSTPNLGANCSLPAGAKHNTRIWEQSYQQLGYGEVLDLYSAIGRPPVTYNKIVQYKWFEFTNRTTEQRHRVSFDDPETLLVKYTALLKAGVAGVGAWTIAATQRSSIAATQSASKDMWQAVARGLAVNLTVPKALYDATTAYATEANTDVINVNLEND